MKRCNICILPETIPNISFNENGICNYCLNYKKETSLGKEKLDIIIDSIKNKNNMYDCVVPMSGGRDSTYVLYTAKKIYQLKVLAVNYDNEFTYKQAFSNMKNACEILNVDFISLRSKNNIAQKLVKNFMREGIFIGRRMQGICNACANGYRSAAYGTALKYKIPLILWGESSDEDTTNMSKAIDGAPVSLLSKILKRLTVFHWKIRYYELLHRIEFRVPGNSIFSHGSAVLKNKDVKEIRLFDYIPWNRKEIKETIMEKLGWRKSPGQISSWRTDCKLHTIVNYDYISKVHCSKDCFGYCNMINSGNMTREKALKQEEAMIVRLSSNKRLIQELLIDEIGIPKKECKKFFNCG